MRRAPFLIVPLLLLTQCKTHYLGISNDTESNLSIIIHYYPYIDEDTDIYSSIIEPLDSFLNNDLSVRRISFDPISHIGTYLLPPRGSLVISIKDEEEEYNYTFNSVIISNGSDSITFNSPNELESKFKKRRYGVYEYSITETDF